MRSKLFEFNGPAKELMPAIDKLIRDMERTEQQIYAVGQEYIDTEAKMVEAVLEDSVAKENQRAAESMTKEQRWDRAWKRIFRAMEE